MRSKLKGPFIDRALLRSVDKINAELEKLLNKRRDSSQVGKVPLETTSSEPITLGNQSLDLRSLKLPTKIWSRRSVILPQFVGLTFQVHNGNRFLPVRVTEEMIGYRFGEFAPTRKPTIHKEVKKK